MLAGLPEAGAENEARTIPRDLHVAANSVGGQLCDVPRIGRADSPVAAIGRPFSCGASGSRYKLELAFSSADFMKAICSQPSG
jgi:hypothetical protein